jgi:hypothetical protein
MMVTLEDFFNFQYKNQQEMWFKIKEIHPTDWESEVPFKASKFVQSIESTFSKVPQKSMQFLAKLCKN